MRPASSVRNHRNMGDELRMSHDLSERDVGSFDFGDPDSDAAEEMERLIQYANNLEAELEDLRFREEERMLDEEELESLRGRVREPERHFQASQKSDSERARLDK